MCWPRRNSRAAVIRSLLWKNCEQKRADVTLRMIKPAQLVAWAHLPGDLACLILQQLPVSDVVNVRQVCAQYAHIARQNPPLVMLLRVDPDNLSIAQAGFQKQSQQQSHGSCSIFRVTNVLSLRMLEGFLKQLEWQVCTCTPTHITFSPCLPVHMSAALVWCRAAREAYARSTLTYSPHSSHTPGC